MAVMAPIISRSRSLAPICSTKLRSIFKMSTFSRLHVGQRRVPGPEVVQGQEHPEVRQRCQGGGGLPQLTYKSGLGDLQAELRRADAVFPDDGLPVRPA